MGRSPVLTVGRDMDHITRMAGTRENPAFTTESGGIGDLVLSGMVKLYDRGRQATPLNLGVSLPTGSVEERDETPASMGAEVQLPYPMQIGSGTFDLLPGITYLGQVDAWSWGGPGDGRDPPGGQRPRLDAR